MGRTPVEIDMEKLDLLCRSWPSKEESAAYFKCSQDTIERKIREHTTCEEFPDGLTFKQFREECFAPVRQSIRRKLIKQALDGKTAELIFANKALCGLSEKPEGEDTKTIVNNFVNMSDEQLDAKIEMLNRKRIGQSGEG